jgi:hypothetical protein
MLCTKIWNFMFFWYHISKDVAELRLDAAFAVAEASAAAVLAAAVVVAAVVVAAGAPRVALCRSASGWQK